MLLWKVFCDMAEEFLTLNGFTYKSKKLTIEIAKNLPKSETDKSILLYNYQGIERGKGDQGNHDTSSKNKNTAIRTAPAASSRQGDNHTAHTEEEQGFWEQSFVVIGDRKHLTENKSMAQELQEKHKHLELEKRKQRKLLIEVDCNQRNISKNAFPNASLIYTALIEQMGLTNNCSNHQVEAIYQSDPNNSCGWFVMFSSQSSKDSFEGKEAQLSWTDKNNKKYIHHVQTKATPRFLLTTLHSSPLIDDELRDVFHKWGMVKNITHRGHDFAPYIDSGLQRVFLHLHQGVKPEDIPRYITLPDRVSRKLYFRGEKYVPSAVLTIHTQKAEQNRC